MSDPHADTFADPSAPDQWAIKTESEVLNHALDQLAEDPGLAWGSDMLDRALRVCGLSSADGLLLFPNGAQDLAALLSRDLDAKMHAALSELPLDLKIRQKIHQALMIRLELLNELGRAAHAVSAFLALPWNVALAGRLVWETADHIWRFAGDTATDENHYSKRMIVSGIFSAAVILRLSSGKAAAESFVAARIENVMSFEKWKAGLDLGDPLKAMAETFARFRYGGGKSE